MSVPTVVSAPLLLFVAIIGCFSGAITMYQSEGRRNEYIKEIPQIGSTYPKKRKPWSKEKAIEYYKWLYCNLDVRALENYGVVRSQETKDKPMWAYIINMEIFKEFKNSFLFKRGCPFQFERYKSCCADSFIFDKDVETILDHRKVFEYELDPLMLDRFFPRLNDLALAMRNEIDEKLNKAGLEKGETRNEPKVEVDVYPIVSKYVLAILIEIIYGGIGETDFYDKSLNNLHSSVNAMHKHFDDNYGFWNISTWFRDEQKIAISILKKFTSNRFSLAKKSVTKHVLKHPETLELFRNRLGVCVLEILVFKLVYRDWEVPRGARSNEVDSKSQLSLLKMPSPNGTSSGPTTSNPIGEVANQDAVNLVGSSSVINELGSSCMDKEKSKTNGKGENIKPGDIPIIDYTVRTSARYSEQLRLKNGSLERPTIPESIDKSQSKTPLTRVEPNQPLAKKLENIVLDENSIQHDLLLLLLTGHLSTTLAVTWTLYNVSTDKNHLDSMGKPVLDKIPKSDLLHLNYEKLQHPDLVAVDNGIIESMRKYPPIPFITRKSEKDITLSRYTIPAKSPIAVAASIIDHNEKKFQNSNTSQSQSLVDFHDDRKLKNLIPFSINPRKCPGSELGLMIARFLVINCLSSYRIEKGHADKVSFTADCFTIPAGGHEILISHRPVNGH